jgi:hypothetical protein
MQITNFAIRNNHGYMKMLFHTGKCPMRLRPKGVNLNLPDLTLQIKYSGGPAQLRHTGG